MLDNSTPQIRALVKTVFFVLTVLISAGLVILGIEVLGMAVMSTVLLVLVLCFFIYLAYSITLSQERYQQCLRELHKTVRE